MLHSISSSASEPLRPCVSISSCCARDTRRRGAAVVRGGLELQPTRTRVHRSVMRASIAQECSAGPSQAHTAANMCACLPGSCWPQDAAAQDLGGAEAAQDLGVEAAHQEVANARCMSRCMARCWAGWPSSPTLWRRVFLQASGGRAGSVRSCSAAQRLGAGMQARCAWGRRHAGTLCLGAQAGRRTVPGCRQAQWRRARGGEARQARDQRPRTCGRRGRGRHTSRAAPHHRGRSGAAPSCQSSRSGPGRRNCPCGGRGGERGRGDCPGKNGDVAVVRGRGGAACTQRALWADHSLW